MGLLGVIGTAGVLAVVYLRADTSNVGQLGFTQPLKIPPLAEPRLDANGRKVFDLRLQPGTSELLPGRPAETWGVNGAYLGPTRELRGRFDGADDTFDLWKVRGAAWLLRHEDRGLMGQFVVVRPGQASQPPAHAHG
jgi:hypothetical protein